MYDLMLPLHIVLISLMLLLLNVETTAQVMASSGVPMNTRFWRRLHMMGYHTLMVAVVATGILLAMETGDLKKGGWLHTKLGVFLVLLALGSMVGRRWKRPMTPKDKPMLFLMDVAVVMLSLALVYLAMNKPF
ncbi:MAG: hypothetical protein OEV94_07120 [Deltaproteobacteria bacterium]|nr:hypothetical protein [Deltaproteobacteria bacterium]